MQSNNRPSQLARALSDATEEDMHSYGSSSTEDSLRLKMPGDHEHAAEEIKAVSPEGLPGDAGAGPGALSVTMLAMFGLVLLAAMAGGIVLGWPAGVAILAIGSLALLANPVMIATTQRVKDRKEVLREHSHGPSA